MTKSWQVHKFGGTSVGTAARIKDVAQIIKNLNSSSRPAVVVSAIKGVTDKLIWIAEAAQRRDKSYENEFLNLKNLHLETLNSLVSKENQKVVLDSLESDFQDLAEILRGLSLSGLSSTQNVEFISGFGEIWSAQLLSAHLCELGLNSTWLDARKVLNVNHVEKSVIVNWHKSAQKLQSWLKLENSDFLIITGFVASTDDGTPTTLKRNGSDYSASIFGVLLDAPEIFIWTDVDGIYSADPRLVPEAIILDDISYNEAAELAYFGAKVVHPATMGPAMGKNKPIWIRNTFNPKNPGTKIHKIANSNRPVTGLSVIDDVALLNIEGTGMTGIAGIAERFFSSLSKANVSVIMVSQGSSEHSICIAILESQKDLAKTTVEKAFYAELHQGLIEKVEITPSCSILAVVGDNMVRSPGVAGRFFKALGQAAINIKAIAQGSSERNISAVIGKVDSTRALRAVHSAFYLSDQTLSIGIIGAGVVGGAFLDQLAKKTQDLKTHRQIDLRIRGIINSKKMCLHDKNIDLTTWRAGLMQSQTAGDLTTFEKHLVSGEFPHSVIIDLTGSHNIAGLYSGWLEKGFNIITANKKANTKDQKYYDELRSISRKRHTYFVYSTNVGAGLPIIQTLRDLHLTGDKILEIQGILSGTLSYLFNGLTSEKPFSQAVREAKDKGFTEPDPREDLSGQDVARKLVILAREIGIKLELSDVDVQNLVPKALRDVTPEKFLQDLYQFDGEMKETLKKAEAQGQVYRYVASLTQQGKAKISLETFAKSHAFSGLTGSDNIVAFKTERYCDQPLIIQGPGAGPQVTAAGVFADLLRLVTYLGAPL